MVLNATSPLRKMPRARGILLTNVSATVSAERIRVIIRGHTKAGLDSKVGTR